MLTVALRDVTAAGVGIGARAATSVVAGLAGLLMIIGSVGVWRTTDQIGMEAIRIAGTGSYGLGQTLATHPLGWVLIGIGLMLLVAAGVAWLRPIWSGVAALALGLGALSAVVILGWVSPGRMSHLIRQLGLDLGMMDDMGPGWGLILTTVAASLATAGGLASVVVIESPDGPDWY